VDVANGNQLLCAASHNVASAAGYEPRDEEKRFPFDPLPSGTCDRAIFAAASRSQRFILCGLVRRYVVLDVVLHLVSRRAGNIATRILVLIGRICRWERQENLQLLEWLVLGYYLQVGRAQVAEELSFTAE